MKVKTKGEREWRLADENKRIENIKNSAAEVKIKQKAAWGLTDENKIIEKPC